MKTIKFRAWDSKNRKMRDVKCLKFNWGGKPLLINGCVDQECRTEDLMQFTNLKDKNGVEIYEGDLVRIEVSTDENDPLITHGIFTVYFYAGSFRIDTNEDGGYPLSDYLHQDCEVIGNIYENPELLRGTE